MSQAEREEATRELELRIHGPADQRPQLPLGHTSRRCARRQGPDLRQDVRVETKEVEELGHPRPGQAVND